MESAPLILAFAVGALIGCASAWLLMPARRNQRRIERERDEARQALSRYRDEVDQHFLQTADTVNQLTLAYKAVHEQLADGARKLCSEEGRRLAVARSLEMVPADEEAVEADLHAPLDYAPSHQGTLSESYGYQTDDELAGYDATEDELDQYSQVAPRDYAEGCSDQGCPPAEEPKRR